jgi:hypothetical protein
VIQLIQQKNRYMLFFIGYLILYIGILFFVGTRLQCWRDECTMVTLTRPFITNLTLDLLKHYEQPVTPLSFLLYGFWGKIFGDNLIAFRSLSLLLAVLSYLVLFKLFDYLLNNLKAALLLTIYVSLNPYMLGISMFFYRDILAFFLFISGVAAFIYKKPILFGLCTTFGILSNQFFIFLPIAAGLCWLLRLVFRKETRLSWMGIFSILVSVIPIIALFVFWGGIYPDNSFRSIFREGVIFTYRPNFLSLYIILLFIYLSPVILFYWKDFLSRKKVMIASLLLGGLYFFFPIRATFIPDYFTDTTGYFHKAIRLIVGEHYEQFFLFAGFVLGLNILLTIFLDIKNRLIIKDFHTEFFIDLTILSFLVVMPLYFLAWEKYFLPLIPLVIIFISLTMKRSRSIIGITKSYVSIENHHNVEADNNHQDM